MNSGASPVVNSVDLAVMSHTRENTMFSRPRSLDIKLDKFTGCLYTSFPMWTVPIKHKQEPVSESIAD
jgi:hypothetical protein